MSSWTRRRDWAPDGRDPAWKSDRVTPRPALTVPLRLMIVHYTGVTSRTYIGDPVEPALDNLFDWAFDNGKGDEYNFVVGFDGSTWEWAGTKQAAHCSNMNTTSLGVLLLLAEGEIPPDALVDGFQALRRELVDVGALTVDHGVDQHGQHFATACPGTEVKNRWQLFDTPLTPTPPPSGGDDMPPTLLSVTGVPGYDPATQVIHLADGRYMTYRWIRDEDEYAQVRADFAYIGWSTTPLALDFHDLPKYGVLIGPAP